MVVIKHTILVKVILTEDKAFRNSESLFRSGPPDHDLHTTIVIVLDMDPDAVSKR